MTLKEISQCYLEAAALLSTRLAQLRRELEGETDQDRIWHLKRRIAELTPILTQMYELADVTEHYYETGYQRNKKYTM